MPNTSRTRRVPDRDIFYFRQRQKNRVFADIAEFFAEQAEELNLTKRDVAEMLGRDPAQITRWLSAPSNLTLDTISDLLLALGAEMDHRIVRFADRPKANALHPLIAGLRHREAQVQVRTLGMGNGNDEADGIQDATAAPSNARVTLSVDLS